MRILAIETSSAGGAVAAGNESGIAATVALAADRKHARDLAPAMREVCLAAGWPLRTTELVLADVGPGSYTGLRVGLMAAKTLCYTTGARVVAIDSMATLAESAPPSFPIVEVIVDAQQGKVYAARFEGNARRSPGIAPCEPAILSAADWARRLKPGDWITGPAVDRFHRLIPSGCVTADEAARQPNVEALWKVGLRRFGAGIVADFWTLEPMYLRQSSAEIKWDARWSAAPEGHPQG